MFNKAVIYISFEVSGQSKALGILQSEFENVGRDVDVVIAISAGNGVEEGLSDFSARQRDSLQIWRTGGTGVSVKGIKVGFRGRFC